MENKKIQISEKLKDILVEIKDTSEIAKMLLDGVPQENLVKDFVDYISISESDPTKISYLNQERIEIVNRLGEDIWKSPKRYHCKPGGFVQKIFKGINSKSIEIFSNQYKSHLYEKQFQFKLVSGDEIAQNYIYSSYQNQNGSLGASCMKYDKCLSYFNIYQKNDIVKMLVMSSHNGFVMGRALLWDFQSNGKSWKIMDRIYTIRDEDYSHFFKKWAISNGYLWKEYQNWSNTLQFIENGSESREIKLDIQLKNWKFDYYPYLDTFKWFDSELGTLHNYIPNHFKSDDPRFQLLTLPDGKGENCDYLLFDDIDRKWIYKSDAIRIEDHNIITNAENCNWSDTLNKWILRSESEWNSDLQDHVYIDQSKIDPTLIQKRKEYLKKNMESRESLMKIFRGEAQNRIWTTEGELDTWQ